MYSIIAVLYTDSVGDFFFTWLLFIFVINQCKPPFWESEA